MKIRFFLKGAVILLLTSPFLFSVELCSQNLFLTPAKNQYNQVSLKSGSRLNKNGYLLNQADSNNTDSTFTTEKSKQKLNKKFKMKKSPTTAVLLSMVVPGAGQFYNESYWKIPIIGGLVGYFGYEYFRQNNLYKDFRDQYITSQTPQNPNGDLNLKELREFYRNERDNFVWYFMIVYVVNLVDAYVDAHLFDFDVKDEKISYFNSSNRTYRLKFNYRF